MSASVEIYKSISSSMTGTALSGVIWFQQNKQSVIPVQSL